MGHGPSVLDPVAEDSSNTSDNNDSSTPTTIRMVLLHVQALLRDGTVLLDTRLDDAPLLYGWGQMP